MSLSSRLRWLALLAAPYLGGLTAGAPSEARAQEGDSQSVRRAARDAQASFERRRRWNLPFVFGASGGRCDEQIGRFCYWYDDSDFGNAPAEPERIQEARARLLGALDSAGSALADDGWIAGQRVRYLIEDGRSAEAVAVARECQATPWWCDALAGFAFHTSGDFRRADSAYRRALRAMPSEERCRWTDLSLLLEGDARKQYRKLSCAERSGFEARFWWLAQPLYSLPGNDLRTEHLARITMSRLQQDARSAHAIGWGQDLHELVVRYGWPERWSRERPPGSVVREPVIIGHEPAPSFNFFPAARALDDPTSAAANDWTLSDEQARARYAPSYAATFAPLPHQAATFRRGSRTVVVAAYDLRDHSLFAGLPLQAALVLSADEHSRPVIRRTLRAASADVLVAAAARDALLLSLEVRSVEERRVARARAAVRAPGERSGRVSLSELLLFDPPDSLPRGLWGVVPLARGSERVRSGERIGLFWETYGLHSGGEPIGITVTLVKEGKGFFRRVAEALGAARRSAAVRLRWREVAEPRGGVAGRAVAVDLPRLSRGRYRLELAIDVAGQGQLAAARRIRVP